MKKIGILTTLSNLDPAYSLVTVILQQLKMLEKYGYQPILFTLNNFDDKVPEYVELRKVVPQFILEPYALTGSVIPQNFEDDVKRTVGVYEKDFADLDCLITHDIIFINSYLIYNVALKKANLERLPMLHQIHSAPSDKMLLPYPWNELWGLPYPYKRTSKLIYMNYTEQVAAAEMYGVFPEHVKVVFNPMDLRMVFNFSELTSQLIDDYKLFEADIICVYPVSSTRMDDAGKAVRKVIAVMANLKELGQSVRLILPNAHANADKEKQTIQEYLVMAKDMGLSPGDVIFTSLYNPPNYESGIPHQNVIELFQLANIFIFPSFSENAPLILLEAAATKNLLVLNEDFKPMIDFFGPEASYNFRFKSRLINETQYSNGEDVYFKDMAKIILADLNSSRINKAFTTLRQKFNIDWVAKNQLIPAIEEVINNGRGV